MEYTILILLLPLASFLVLGLAGMKMRPAAAGAVGTAVRAVVALLSYWTAFEYFSAGRDAAFNSVRNSRGFCCRVSRPFRWFGTVSSMPNPPDMRC